MTRRPGSAQSRRCFVCITDDESASGSDRARRARARGMRADPNTTELHELQKLLDERGLRMETVTGDGNCLFHAVLEQLPSHDDTPETHHDLRARTVDFMQSNLKMFKELEGLDVWELDGAACSPEEYFDHMRPSGVHAGVPELFALARMLHTDIVVFQHQAPQVQMFQADGAPSQDVQDSAAVTNRIRVSYRCHAYSNACHYDAVVPHGHEKKGKKRSRSHGKKGKKLSPTNRTAGRKRPQPET